MSAKKEKIKISLLLFLVFGRALALSAQSPPKNVEVAFDYAVALVFEGGGEENYVKTCFIGLPENVDFSFKENKIVLQALQEHFAPTNMIVELQNGKIHVFNLIYSDVPSSYVVYLRADKQSPSAPTRKSGSETGVASSGLSLPPGLPQQRKPTPTRKSKRDSDKGIIDKIKGESDYLHGTGLIHAQMISWVGGIWKAKGHYFFKITIDNRSTVDFPVAGVNMVVEERKKMKRSVDMRVQMNQYNTPTNLLAKAKQKLIFVVETDPITIQGNKKITIDIWEKSPGERRVVLRLSSGDLLNTRTL